MEINLSDIIFGIVNFLIMAFILNKLLFQPIMRVMDQRDQQLEEKKQQTTDLQKEIANGQAQYEAVFAKANKTAQEIIDQATKDGEEEKANLIEAAKKNTQEMLEQARKDLAAGKEKIKSEIKDEVTELSIMMAGKLLNRPLRLEEHQKVVQDFLKGYVEESEKTSLI